MREVGLGLVTAGLVVLLFVAYELVGTNLSEEHSQSVLAREFHTALTLTRGTTATTGKSTNLVTPTTPSTSSRALPANNAQKLHATRSHEKTQQKSTALAGVAGSSLPLPPPGGALDHLVIPAIGLSRYVVQGVGEPELQMGPGHYPGTPLPGQPGNVGIAGHRTTFGAPFFRLNEVSRGDLVLLTDTSGTTWVYSVVRQWVVAPDDNAVLDPTHDAVLTLTTCNPRFEATTRLVVRAVLVDRVARGSAVPSSPLHVPTSPLQVRAPAQPAGATPGSADNAAGTGGERSPIVGSPSGRAARPSAGERTAAGPNSANAWTWVATIGFGLLALLGWVAARVFATRLRRYSKALVLAAGALVCLVPLWFAFENLVDLLPASL